MTAMPEITVAYDAGPLLGPITGVGVATEQMAAALERRDDIVLRRYACSFRGTLHDGMTRLPIPAAIAHRLWGSMSAPRLDHWLRPADIVHGTNYTVPPSRLPRVVTVYDCWFLRHPEHAGGDVGRAGRVLRRAVATGAVVHASSHATADAVRELLGAARVHVVPLAAAPLPVSPAPATPVSTTPGSPAPAPAAPFAGLDGAPFVLAIGTLERRKNLPRLIAAFGHVVPTHPGLRLVIVGGDGDDRESVDLAIDRLPEPARSGVLLTGRVDASTKQWLLDHARLLAYPSLDEGFGFPLLEAMQLGVPVVASTAGSIPEVAADAAVLVAPDDVDALAHAIASVLDDDDLRATLVERGHRRVEQFSWAATAAGLADLYRLVIQEGR